MACAFLCELARAWCQSGCSIGVLTARLTFHPPPPSYVLVAINAAEGKDTADAASDAASRAFSNSAHPSTTPETERQDSADIPSRLNTRLLHGRADSSGNVGTQHGRVGTSTAASFAAQPPAHGPGSESQGSAAPAPGAGGSKVPEIELQDVAPPDGDATEAAAGEESDSAPTGTRGSDGGGGVTGQVQRVVRVVAGATAGAGTGAGSGGARTWHGFAPTSQFRVMWLAQGPLPPEYSSMLSVHRVTTRRKNTIPVFLYVAWFLSACCIAKLYELLRRVWWCLLCLGRAVARCWCWLRAVTSTLEQVTRYCSATATRQTVGTCVTSLLTCALACV